MSGYNWSIVFTGSGLPSAIAAALEKLSDGQKLSEADIRLFPPPLAGETLQDLLNWPLTNPQFGSQQFFLTCPWEGAEDPEAFEWRILFRIHDDVSIIGDPFFAWLAQFAKQDHFFGTIFNEEPGPWPDLLFAIKKRFVRVQFDSYESRADGPPHVILHPDQNLLDVEFLSQAVDWSAGWGDGALEVHDKRLHIHHLSWAEVAK